MLIKYVLAGRHRGYSYFLTRANRLAAYGLESGFTSGSAQYFGLGHLGKVLYRNWVFPLRPVRSNDTLRGSLRAHGTVS
jgi:hypothetical protein